MKEIDEPGIDHFRDLNPQEKIAARNSAGGDSGGDHSAPSMTIDDRCPGQLAARARLFLFVSFLLAVITVVAPVVSPAQVSVGISVTYGPPAIPIYAQPLCPGPAFIWIPGYWAWDPAVGYYWVPGMWVPAPFVGALWTPGYWGWSNGVYIWHEGYWGTTVGFYGGINYGFGYTGYGYHGGYWSGGSFYYNRTVNNINVTNITTVYSRRVSNVRPAGASFNGGPGGTTVRPTSEQLASFRQRRFSLTDAQRQHMEVARTDPRQRAAVNHGRPAIAATTRPGVFAGRGVKGAERAGVPHKAPPSYKAAPGERARTPMPSVRTHPPFNGPEHMAPRTPWKEPERRMNEPHPAPKRPETTRPSPREEKAKGEKEEPR